jgi:D-3-phosphoglycerate dehydrogenase / 2-oxoglutarate reductase
MKPCAEATVLVTPRSFGVDDPEIRRELEAAVGEVRYSRYGRPLRAEELSGEVGDIDGLIAGLDEIDETVFAAAPSLRVIARYGVGTSNIDLHAAAEHGVVVTNTPGANAEAVAELTIGLMLALARSIVQAARATRAGDWPSMRGVELHGRTVGILGLGKIGCAVAQRAAALGCDVMAHDPYVDVSAAAPLNVRLTSKEEVVASADFLTLHLTATPESFGIVNRELLKRMRRGAYLVNTARGELIVEEDLLWALESGQLRGAALDTLQNEPPARDSSLLERDDVIVTPHLGAHTTEAAGVMGRTTVSELLAVLSDRPARFAVPVPQVGRP